MTHIPGAMYTFRSKFTLQSGLAGLFRSLMLGALLVVFSPLPVPAVGIDQLKIGIVDINRALNQSTAGERSKKLLLATRDQKENELKNKEQVLKKLSEELQNSLMLSETTRKDKEQELREKEMELRQDVQKAQSELQDKERKMTESIFNELKIVVAALAKEGKYDLILEQGASQVILFHSGTFTDLTDQVIARFNKLSPNK